MRGIYSYDFANENISHRLNPQNLKLMTYVLSNTCSCQLLEKLFVDRVIISLYKYFKPAVGNDVFTKKESRKIEECIKQRASEQLEKSAKKRQVTGKHHSYSPELRATIGKYAAENGATRAAMRYSKEMGLEMNESTVRKFKNEYERELAFLKEKGKSKLQEDGCIQSVLALPTKPQGRPLLLGQELD